MKRLVPYIGILAVAAAAAAVAVGWLTGQADRTAADLPTGEPLVAITVEYPEQGSIFPPEITPPMFLWRDPAETATFWRIDVSFGDGTPPLFAVSRGQRQGIGEIDQRCVSPTNELPRLPPEEDRARTWTPDAATWAAIKGHSVASPATVTITGVSAGDSQDPISRGQVTIQTSQDPVGAPIFYRDVPLMPSQSKKGVIKPLAEDALPLIGWRLRSISEPSSRLLLEGLPTCANCHSFSRDGKTLGMDLDGPENDKGAYVLAPVEPQMTIRNEHVISWNSFPDKPPGHKTIGFLSQVSPDGQYAVTTVNEEVYVVNFKDYRFLQVFYPTRGILAWYSRATGRMQALPGADDPRYVHTDAVWSPDGKYLVFARAGAKEAYPEGRGLADRANDPSELPMQYDLYRMPFADGKGGNAEPIAGASQNGMSNTFPKISPDGRWIVFVQCRNGQLMRPDSQLYIVPAQGGRARRMGCNTPLMNSWHSFSPNGRWLVFSSKSRSPYTQMLLTHLDEEGRDSPAILIENATAANRAVNIPEFVNVPPDGLLKIAVPAAEQYRLLDRGLALVKAGQQEQAIPCFQQAVEIDPAYATAHRNLGLALLTVGRADEAVVHYERTVQLQPDRPDAHNDLGSALLAAGKAPEAIAQYERALQLDPDYAEAHYNLGTALFDAGRTQEAIACFERTLQLNPNHAQAHNNLGSALLDVRRVQEAIAHYERALQLKPDHRKARNNLAKALAMARDLQARIRQYEEEVQRHPDSAEALRKLANLLMTDGDPREARRHFERAIQLDPRDVEAHNNLAWLLATRALEGDDLAKAVSLAERACELTDSRSPKCLDTLAAAYAAAGRFPEAVATAQKALDLAFVRGQSVLVKGVEARLELYRAGRPYREAAQPTERMNPSAGQ